MHSTYPWSGTCSIGGGFCQPDAASSAACLAGVEGVNTGCAQCASGVCNLPSPAVMTVWQWLVALNGAGYGGHNDWRLPRLQELESILDYGDSTAPAVGVAFHRTPCVATCTDVNNQACTCTNYSINSVGYFTASRSSPGGAWSINFYRGTVLAGFMLGEKYVRAVRGGS